MPHAGCSIVAIVIGSKSGQCWEPKKETYSKSRTSGESGMTGLEQPPRIGYSAVTFAPTHSFCVCDHRTAGTVKAQEVSKQPGLRKIPVDLAAGRNVAARIGLPL